MASPPPGPNGAGAPNTIIPDEPEAIRYDAYPEVVPAATPGKEDYVMSPSTGPSPQQNGVVASYPSPPAKKIFGLRRPTFFLLALLILVIIVAAVGGGVGGSIAVSKAYDRGLADAAATGTATATATEASSSPTGSRVPRPPTEGVLELDCPSLTDTTHRISAGKSTSIFRATCGVNHSAGRGSKDITRLPAYSFGDCMTACAAFNDQDSVANTTCVLVHFNTKLSLVGEQGGNCWLKSDLGSFEVVDDDEKVDHLVEGELLQ